MTSIVEIHQGQLTTITNEGIELLKKSRAVRTRKTYEDQIKKLMKDLSVDSINGITPEMLVNWLAIASYKVSTKKLTINAVNFCFKEVGLTSPGQHPLVKKVIEGLDRDNAQAVKKAKPVTLDVLRNSIEKIDSANLSGKRDKALMTLAFFTASRVSELTALTTQDLTFNPDGSLTIYITRSKTDQKGHGRFITLNARNDSICPVSAVKAWLQASNVTSAIFVSTEYGRVGTEPMKIPSVFRVFKKRFGQEYSCHSTRAGLVTESINQDVPVAKIMSTTGHKLAQIVYVYYRQKDSADNASNLLK